MRIHYLRRYRMEFDFARSPLPLAALPDDYAWTPWCTGLLDRHASVKFSSFYNQIDSHVFPSLSNANGCRRLMSDICRHDQFLPEATWLIHYLGDEQVGRTSKSARQAAGNRADCQVHTPNREQSGGLGTPPYGKDCATIQGIVKPRQAGSIQNVGVTPEHRGRGLGRALLLRSLHGFRQASMRRVYLDVTAENQRALDLYKSIGFSVLRTMYQAVDFEPEVYARPVELPRDRRRALAEVV